MAALRSLRRALANFLCPWIPATRCYSLKRLLWCLADVDVGKKARLVSSIKIYTSGPVSIGEETFIGHEVLIAGGTAPVHIGAKCDIAPRVSIITGTHRMAPESERLAGEGESHPITIETGCWIGASVTLLGGVKIETMSMIAAGSVVTETIPAYCLAGGVPAKPIKDIRTGASI